MIFDVQTQTRKITCHLMSQLYEHFSTCCEYCEDRQCEWRFQANKKTKLKYQMQRNRSKYWKETPRYKRQKLENVSTFCFHFDKKERHSYDEEMVCIKICEMSENKLRDQNVCARSTNYKSVKIRNMLRKLSMALVNYVRFSRIIFG